MLVGATLFGGLLAAFALLGVRSLLGTAATVDPAAPRPPAAVGADTPSATAPSGAQPSEPPVGTAPPSKASAGTSTKASPVAAASTTVTPSAARRTARPGRGDVRGQPAGLFCRDLLRKGYGYSAAVDYWRQHGSPDQMDIDKNGIPCETVYPARNVNAYWYGQAPAGVSIPHGLLCRDLYERGIDYPTAVAYWRIEGAPDRMDEDLNGRPCETVYSSANVRAFWGS